MAKEREGSTTPEAIGPTFEIKPVIDIGHTIEEYLAYTTSNISALLLEQSKAIDQKITFAEKIVPHFNKGVEELTIATNAAPDEEMRKELTASITALQTTFNTQKELLESKVDKLEILLKGCYKAASQAKSLNDPRLYRGQNYNETKEIDGRRITDTTGPTVNRYAINEDLCNNLIGTYAGQKLHPIEAVLFTSALDELNTKKSAEAFAQNQIEGYPNNVVVVDVFKRDSDGNIAQDKKTGTAETHSVVLWKKKDNEIVLIDPSNTAFTKYLVGPLEALTSNKCQFTTPADKVVKGLKIYDPEQAEPGRGQNDPRDCVDIAVKIGFVTNHKQMEKVAGDIIEQCIILELTNREPEFKAAKGKLSQHSLVDPVEIDTASLKATLSARNRTSSAPELRRRSLEPLVKNKQQQKPEVPKR